MRAGMAADTAAALLFRILSQPTLLFPPLRHAEGVVQHEPLGGYVSSYKRQVCSSFCILLIFISGARLILMTEGTVSVFWGLPCVIKLGHRIYTYVGIVSCKLNYYIG
jgi:hypothetical protein